MTRPINLGDLARLAIVVALWLALVAHVRAEQIAYCFNHDPTWGDLTWAFDPSKGYFGPALQGTFVPCREIKDEHGA